MGRNIWLSPRFHTAKSSFNDHDLEHIEQALQRITECFGQPHAHTGISIRRLRHNIFECRAGLKLRLLFRENQNRLDFFFVGTHDEVRRLIRGDRT